MLKKYQNLISIYLDVQKFLSVTIKHIIYSRLSKGEVGVGKKSKFRHKISSVLFI